MKTERELYEEIQNKSVLKRLVFIDSLNMYLTKDEYSDDDLTIQYCLEINHGWKMWQASANRDGYKLVPVCETCNGYGEVGCQFEGTFTCPDCIGDRLNFKAMIGATP